MRELWQTLRGAPALLLVVPEQLGYDTAYGFALVPPIAAGLFFFRRNAVLLFALCFLAGIVCLLSLQFARLTIGLPAWVGHKANHPLLSSLLVAAFLSPQTPAWIGVVLVVLLVVVDTVLWPQLVRVAVHPALPVFAVLLAIQRQFPISFVNPFDLRPLDDPLTLWYRLHVVLDPVKLYVGNVPGPEAATSAGALLLGIGYLWYTRKISLGLLGGFVCGLAAAAAVFRYDLAFQVSGGPALFIAGYLAADRRRLFMPERFAFLMGATAGAITVVLRTYGQGVHAAWESFLLLGLLTTLIMQLVSGASLVAGRPRVARAPVPLRPTIGSGPVGVPVAALARGPAFAGEPVAVRRISSVASRMHRYEGGPNPDEMIRLMRTQAARGPLARMRAGILLRALALIICNPAGLWLTWRSRSSRRTKWALTALSIIWYPGVLAATLLLLAPPSWLRSFLP